MEAGVLAHILHREGVACLVAGNGLVLGPVVLEHPVDLLHFGDAHHIGQEDAHLEHRFQHHLGPAAQRDKMVHAAHDKGGQHSEQQNGQQPAQNGCAGQQSVLGLFAQMLPYPLFKSGLFLFGVVVIAHADLGGVHHIAVTHDQAFDHGNRSPHQRDLCPDAMGRRRLGLGLDGAIRLAHGAADELGAAHHDAFHQGLPAHTGLETFFVGLIHWVLLTVFTFPLL